MSKLVDMDGASYSEARRELEEIDELPDVPEKATRLSNWKRRYMKPNAWGPTLFSPAPVRDAAFSEVLEKAMASVQHIAIVEACLAKGMSMDEAFAISPPDYENFHQFEAVCGGDPERFFLERGYARSDAMHATIADWFYELAAETAFKLSTTLAFYQTQGECRPPHASSK